VKATLHIRAPSQFKNFVLHHLAPRLKATATASRSTAGEFSSPAQSNDMPALGPNAMISVSRINSLILHCNEKLPTKKETTLFDRDQCKLPRIKLTKPNYKILRAQSGKNKTKTRRSP